ncbi:glycoprotein-N-acetylgalactosamine 3-beta-galactosyltransferase 1-like [Neocloeon triangulifer]|uniref:glycoprotein-N-acetylgalactosamine 3-beta-galactosyltransferase 1-like n=1 Tax=Neocloeon triangulifer TaxID=2078957 RepID=UPI00286F410C|nr:glycoprotein-N-acetylgalactosamine 3-beta-galactosyltransferase 1-like [Neocloeon triangulifer]
MRARMPCSKASQILAFCGAYLVGFQLCLLLFRPQQQPLRPDEPYRDWLATQGLQSSPLTADFVSYGRNVSNEAQFLFRKVNVICVVFTRSGKKAQAIEKTWGPSCNELRFYAAGTSSHKDFEAPDDGQKIKMLTNHKSSWHLLCDVISEIWATSMDHLEWVIFAPEDLFVMPENLRLLVAPLSADKPHYLGHAMTLWNEDYNVAQAGYVLSRGALGVIARRFNNSKACETSGQHWKNEDFYLGKYLGEADIRPTDTRDQWLRGRFHGFNLNQLLFSHKLSVLNSYWRRSIYPVSEGLTCCSDTSITFQGIEPDKVHQFHYLLYHVRPFRGKSYLGSVPAPKPAGDEPWRQFLRDENLWDQPGEEISAKQYYELSLKIASKLSDLHPK